MTTRQATSAGPIERWAHLPRKPPPYTPGGARERMIGDRGEPDLVAAEREQQMRDPIRRRQPLVGGRHAEAVDARAAREEEHAAGLAEQPGAEAALLEDQPRLAVKLAGVVPQEVAEKALCHAFVRC